MSIISNEEGNMIKLKNIAEKVLELKNLHRQRRPIIIEFCGSPKAGKTSCINSLNIFLKRNGFRTVVLHERASVCPINDKRSPVFNVWTVCSAINGILENLYSYSEKVDIVIADRGIFDALCWFEWLKNKKCMDSNEFDTMLNFVTMERWIKYIDLVYVFKADPGVSIEREYANLLTREMGSIMNPDTLLEYNKAIDKVCENYSQKFHNVQIIDTSDLKQNDVGVNVTTTILDVLNDMLIEKIGYFDSKYITCLQEGYNQFSKLENTLRDAICFGNRDEIEASDYIQPIPIAIITNKTRDKVLLIKKQPNVVKGNSPEKGKILLYAGGHMRKEDDTDSCRNDFKCLAIETLKREINEELGISVSLENIDPFFLYTPTNEKSKKHLAVCFVVELDLINVKFTLDSYELTQKTGKSKSGTLEDVSKLASLGDVYEDWSIEIMNKVFSIKFNEQISLGKQQLLDLDY